MLSNKWDRHMSNCRKNGDASLVLRQHWLHWLVQQWSSYVHCARCAWTLYMTDKTYPNLWVGGTTHTHDDISKMISGEGGFDHSHINYVTSNGMGSASFVSVVAHQCAMIVQCLINAKKHNMCVARGSCHHATIHTHPIVSGSCGGSRAHTWPPRGGSGPIDPPPPMDLRIMVMYRSKIIFFQLCYLICVEHEKCSEMCVWNVSFGPKLRKWDYF